MKYTIILIAGLMMSQAVLADDNVAPVTKDSADEAAKAAINDSKDKPVSPEAVEHASKQSAVDLKVQWNKLSAAERANYKNFGQFVKEMRHKNHKADGSADKDKGKGHGKGN